MRFASPLVVLPNLMVHSCRLDWGEKVLNQNATREIRGSKSQILMRGLPAAIGMLQGPVVSICPHATTGQL